jgi:hypothetical protein
MTMSSEKIPCTLNRRTVSAITQNWSAASR